MDSARDRITGEIIDAEQLWFIEHVDKDRLPEVRKVIREPYARGIDHPILMIDM